MKSSMKSYGAREALDKGQLASHALEHHPDQEPIATSGSPAEAEGAGKAAAPTDQHDTTQADRAVMHPKRHDLEWRYCRNGWTG